MLRQLERTKAQWSGYDEVIDYWLELRRQLLVEYYNVAGVAAKKKQTLPTKAELDRFCDYLVDYISTGHFKIYNMVMERWQSTGFSATKETDNLYFRIVDTTDPLLDYNDKFSAVDLDDDDYDATDFDQDMSAIGEWLEQRFELEDTLIRVIADSLAHPPGA
ncbi:MULTISPECIES: Rsd/AlgQ family anti-sigma factor [Salinivibrio]|uniref:Anti-RNA polymerase sigma 70 factor n=1 Tax=Salinivibrio kushneri TaxID=1908198 RepID=A0AB36JSA2_9GAMM|nr:MULTISPECIES: Rsd/AlgQ family anti-sigma factor [Salinivibrio]ODP98501.1 anti-RNA polymerase sigma 70 factor [Salinivibrio sp. BNH]OOE32790.1 anti-RNA polymerase sigma 70 factor [Salinivibrio kushneri]OOE33361.1 anti-RNA polymerase sigma 70 factor [Salinivibrio kushneri]OOE38670.1 anti-RNA polymerase sigma 70 factor [Salinivibrio kushneri]OOE42213.1 anti-RNA polymerase sigma 70 factor [Salinivibrio kushneri]